MVPSRLADFQPLKPAEERVIADLRSGVLDRLGDGVRPIEDDPARAVRAELLRFLILGGDDDSRPHEKGLRIAGACIEGVLDLEGCRIPRDIGLKDCLFNRAPTLRSAVIDNLFLPSIGAYVAGRAKEGQLQLLCFRDQPEAASYPEFKAWVYSLDVLLPVLEIGQKQYWRPDPLQRFGSVALNYYYLQTILGWVLSLLAVAGFSGLAKSS